MKGSYMKKEEIPYKFEPEIELKPTFNNYKCCENCNNNPKNNPAATGICNCILPLLECPIT